MELFVGAGLLVALGSLGAYLFRQSAKDGVPENVSQDIRTRLNTAKEDYFSAVRVILKKGVENALSVQIKVDGNDALKERETEYYNSVKTDLKRLALSMFGICLIFSIQIFFGKSINSFGNSIFSNFEIIKTVIGLSFFLSFGIYAFYAFSRRPDSKGHKLIRYIEDETERLRRFGGFFTS